MRPIRLFLSVIAILWTSTAPAFPSTPEFWECIQPDAAPLYINKEQSGCRAMELRPLSVVETPPPSAHIAILPLAPVERYDVPSQAEWYPNNPPSGYSRNDIANVPDWGRDWHARNTLTGSVQENICSRYGEWIRLNERTRGGFFFGSDPSYGGDPTGSNLTTPSYSFYDNARYLTLSRLFGQGFIPIGCQ